MQHLFRSNGVTQAEVAERMSKLVRRTTGETTSSSTFVSALSRFVNAKNSAFPGWFQKVETRLIPLALAIGLENDQILWTLLHQSAGLVSSEPSIWHSAWPGCRVEVPIELSGRSLDAIAVEIEQHCRDMAVIHQSPWFFFVGEQGTGCTHCVNRINERLELPLEIIEFTNMQRAQTLRRLDNSVKMVIVRHGEWVPNGLDRSYAITDWGLRELDILVHKLVPQVAQHTASTIKQYYEACVQNPNMLGHDLRAKTLIETLAIVVQSDVPETSATLQQVVAKEQWRQACLRAPQLSEFGMLSWSKLCWSFIIEFPIGKIISLTEAEERIGYLEAHQGFELHNSEYALKVIEQLETASKSKRQEAIDALRRWVHLSCGKRTLDLLIEGDLLQYDVETDSLYLPSNVLGWACLFPEIIEPFSRPMAHHPHLSDIVKALCVNGLNWSQLNLLLRHLKKDNPLLVAKLFLVFLAQYPQPISENIEKYVALVCGALFQTGLILPYEREFLIETLQSLSQTYASQLPIICTSAEEQLWCHLPRKAIAKGWRLPNRIQLQAYLPYQCPPQNISEWYQWHPRPPFSISAEAVLIWHMKNGDPQSVMLLAESFDFSAWHQLSLPIRLNALQVSEFSVRTPLAFQHIVDRLFENQPKDLSLPPMHFELLCNSVEQLGWSQLRSLCSDWIMTNNDLANAPFLGRSKASIHLAHHFNDVSILIEWWTHYWIALESNPDMVRFEKALVCIELAILLWESDVEDPIHKLWDIDSVLRSPIQEQLLLKSLAAKIPAPIIKWLETDWEPPQLRMALRSSPELLKLAWRHRGAKRSAVLLQWAGQMNPTPRWALNEALREAQLRGKWPRWLPPNRPEAVPIVQWMTSNAKGENQFWWATQLHRHQPWPKELLSALQFWILDDAFPFSVHPWAISEGLSINNTPPLEPSDKLQLCAQAIDAQHDWEWLLMGLKRLWRHHRTAASNKDVFLLGSILLPIGEIDLLKEGDTLPEAFVRRQLPFVLLRASSDALKTVLRESTAQRSFIIPAIHEELLKRNDANSILFFEHMFKRRAEPYWLTGLARYAPQKAFELLEDLGPHDEKVAELLPIVLPLLPVGEALRLQELFGFNMSEEIESEPATGGAGMT